MKKATAFILSALLTLSLTACGNSNNSNSESSVSSESDILVSHASEESSKDSSEIKENSQAEESSKDESSTDNSKSEESSTTAVENSETSQASKPSQPSKPSTEASKPSSETSKPSEASKPSSETSKPSEPSTSPSETEEIGPLLQACFLDIVEDGTFYLDATMNGTSAGQKFDNAPIIMATNGVKVYVNMSVMGMEVKMIMDEENAYILYDEQKIAMKTSISSMTEDITSSIDTTGSKLVGSGEEFFNGKSCSYEEYVQDRNYMKYYFYDNTLVGITMKSSTTDTSSKSYVNATIVVNELSSDAPASLFVIPSDYKIVNSGSLGSLGNLL